MDRQETKIRFRWLKKIRRAQHPDDIDIDVCLVCWFVSSVFITYLTPSLAATRFHCDRCDKPLSLLTALAKASQFFFKRTSPVKIKGETNKREKDEIQHF